MTPTIGMYLLPVFLLISVGLFVAIALLWKRGNVREYGMASDVRIFAWIVIALAVIYYPMLAFGYYPYDMDYHAYHIKDGNVAQIDKRLVNAGEGMQEKFVVVFDGNPQQYGCTDTRCALVDSGEYLKLACKKTWDYGATDGWDCKFREHVDRETS